MSKPVSEKLRAAIRKSGLSANRLAKETGVDQTSISDFLREEGDMRVSNIDKLAAYLGLELKDR